MTDSLPPFSGDDATCIKCGNEGAATQYLPHGRCLHGPTPTIVGWHPNERLHRECLRCGHQWDEATIGTTGAQDVETYANGGGNA